MDRTKAPAVEFWTKMELGNDKQPQLHDLSADPTERNNVATQHPEVVKELVALLRQIKS